MGQFPGGTEPMLKKPDNQLYGESDKSVMELRVRRIRYPPDCEAAVKQRIAALYGPN
jgi:hypothetical protein